MALSLLSCAKRRKWGIDGDSVTQRWRCRIGAPFQVRIGQQTSSPDGASLGLRSAANSSPQTGHRLVLGLLSRLHLLSSSSPSSDLLRLVVVPGSRRVTDLVSGGGSFLTDLPSAAGAGSFLSDLSLVSLG